MTTPLSLTHAYVSQAGVLLLLSGIAQLIMGTVVIVHMIMVLNEVLWLGLGLGL